MPFEPLIPSPVQELSRAALEWDRFLALLAAYAQSAIGRAWTLALAPSTDLAWLDRQHSLVDETRRLLHEGVRPALAALFDPTDLLAKSRLEGAALEPDEIRRLLDLADQISSWAAILRTPPDRLQGQLPFLTTLAGPILAADLRPLVEIVRAKMLPDGTLTDDASPELGRIRRDMDRQQRAIQDSLRTALRRLSDDGSTQEDLITIRGERFVIPVKSELKRRVSGVVHGASSSGQTVYLEPLETIELNNELVRLFEEELAEIHRIFLAMTRQIAAQAHVIAPGAAILAEVETLSVRARFAHDYACSRPRFSGVSRFEHGAYHSTPPEVRLTAARHPLLEARLKRPQPDGRPAGPIVPLSLSLEDDARQLIISGPNTGGKTVGLKTTGLLALMAQAGIPVPAFEATLPLFTAFHADIGDAQSIEQNLSTFSAHIVNLTRIAQVADPTSLVLLDELGSATDPEEGAALAVAIAEHFLHARAWSIISTHQTALKVYAENTPGVTNAAVGFNAETLAPTYELRQGVPGASAGINIAQRLGLYPQIVEAARSHLSTQTLDIGAFLDRLHEQIAALGQERAALREQEQELRRERGRLETEGLQEYRARTRELEQHLQQLLRDFEQQARSTVQGIEDSATRDKLAQEASRRVARARQEFSAQFATAIAARKPNAMQRAAAQAAAHTRNPQLAALGDLVKLKIGQTGKVTRELDAANVEVSIGIMKMRVPRTDIAAILESAGKPGPSPVSAARKRNVSVHLAEPDQNMRPEINVIGQTADQATDEVQKFVDQAFLAGLQRVRVVHGTGMGILRRTLRAALEGHPHVATVTEADNYEGGQGATIVELRQ
ncbi:MAG TPA: Smr/MutS family protein [Acidobacteriaceae bacterium]